MKFDRLLSILLLLQQRERVPATELARRLEVSVRTVYRDVEALSAAGIPVYAERGRYGGVRLLPGFRTNVTGLTRDEARALFVLVGQSAHSALGLDRALGSALRKVMAALPAPHRPAAELTSRRLLIDPDGWLGGPHDQLLVDELYDAVLADRRLRIVYRHSGRAAADVYGVDPYGLVCKAGTWYLVADRAGRPRLFRADRLHDVAVTSEPVARRAEVELGDVWEELRREVEHRGGEVVVRARVRRRRLDMLRRLTRPHFLREVGADSSEAEKPADGRHLLTDDAWLTVELEYPVPVAARQLLQFGTDVEVLGPPEAVREVSRAAAALVELYSRPG
ncbi:WYL domain-containing protein [Streptomyces sp. 549]|uniref:helix-turn-helix transcriptional regulator n=1 Tax=Streptomyces sp. 549 TaxID=3049076 RepID=UPI0024C2B345|nr:WYL domain-containing protein [Streptomyces sp. 549]MDK1471921.1 WYL domain-containing protein [Streptomyces sp. 549]